MKYLALVLALAACGDDGPSGVYFDLASAHDTDETFWDLPFPSDLRLDDDGTLDLTGYPTRDTPIVDDMLRAAKYHVGAPMMPTAYVRFAVDVPARSPDDVIPASADEDVFLVDLAAGTLFPLVASTLSEDDFAPTTLVAVAPRPGVILAPDTTYALVFRAGFAPDASPAPDFVALRHGSGEAADVYAPLWPVLDELGVDDALVATVFTTGDEQRRMYERSELVRAAHDAVISTLAIDPTDGASHDGYCELVGTVTYPQFQTGEPPFRNDGVLEYEPDGTPVMQAEMTVPLVITLPFGEMPENGWPLYQWVHGSGGLARHLVDRGPTLEIGGEYTVGEGPAYVIAPHGVAAASSAMPLNPERYPGASDYEYLNINNLTALPFTFHQGVFEQRLLLDALLELDIDPSVVCAGVTLPTGATSHHFDPDTLMLGGHSMGAMYTNMVGAVEPRFNLFVPTGAGGMWNKMILESTLIPGAREILVAAFATDAERLNFMHPALNLLSIGFQISEPMLYMSRLAAQPLDEDGFRPRHVYQSTATNDPYFPTSIYDVAALAYGNQQAGEEIWPTMQDALALEGLDGVATYPVSANRTVGGTTITSAVVQFHDDGILSGHNVSFQLPEVMHQYGCFLETYLATGTPVVVAPGALDDPCN